MTVNFRLHFPRRQDARDLDRDLDRVGASGDRPKNPVASAAHAALEVSPGKVRRSVARVRGIIELAGEELTPQESRAMLERLGELDRYPKP